MINFSWSRTLNLPLLMVAGLVLLLPRQAEPNVQGCRGGSCFGVCVNGTVVIGDGTTAPSNGTYSTYANIGPVCPPPIVCTEDGGGFLPGSAFATPFANGQTMPFVIVDVLMCSADAQSAITGLGEWYSGGPPGGSGQCTQGSNPPATETCSGNFSLTVYSRYGSISGQVTSSGAPVPAGTQVSAYDPANFSVSLRTVLTDVTGHYTFSFTDDKCFFGTLFPSLCQQNNWGVLVQGDGSGPLTATYTVFPGPPPANLPPGDPPNAKHVAVQSGKMSTQDFALASAGPNPSTQSCPVAGKPVSISTGNVFFSEKDAVIPGVASPLSFVRTYNSLEVVDGSAAGVFGLGWTHSYEKSMAFAPSGQIMLREGTGVPLYFQNGQPIIPITEQSSIAQSGSSYVRSFRAGGSEVYDGFGRLTSIVDPLGNATTLTWDTSGHLTTITNPGSRAVTLTYSGGHVSSLVGPGGVTLATYTYYPSPSNLLKSVTYGDGSGYTFAYTSGNQLGTVTDNSNVVLETHTYTADGKASTSSISGGQEQYTLSYSPSQTTVIDALGNITTYSWTSIAGMTYPTAISGPCSSCGGGGSQTQQWTHDGNGRVATYTDGAGEQTKYQRYSNGDLQSVTDPLNHVTSYTYDTLGRVLTSTAADSGLTKYSYGPAGPLTITDPLNRVSTLTYLPNGNPQTIKDPRGKVTTLAYNSFGDLTSSTDPLSHQETFGYDALGRRTTVTDALNNTTTTAYDAVSRITQIKNPDGTHTDLTYDLGGRLKTVTDPLSKQTTYAYDAYGRLQTVTDANSGVNTYGYDAMSNLTSIMDARGKVTTFAYADRFNRVTSVTYAGGAVETFGYDLAGRPSTKTDRKNVTTTYMYSPTGRLLGKSYSDTTPSVTYTYDPVGRLATAANGIDSLAWSYDLAGQMSSEASTANSSTVGYTYDNDGNRVALTLNGSGLLTYSYDDASRLTTITQGSNNFSFAYDSANRRASLTYPKGSTTTYGYDNLSRLTSIGVADVNLVPITSFTYSYDNVGNRLTKVTPRFKDSYVYDPVDRLTQVSRLGGKPPLAGEAYTYDPEGNRLTSLSTTGNWLYDDRNELKSNSTDTFTYDANGNLMQKVEGSHTWTYQWDAENRLQKVFNNGTPVASYAYDPLARRIRRVTSPVPKIFLTTAYLYDAQAILARTASGATVKFVHGPRIDEPLAQEDSSGNLSLYYADALGSIAGYDYDAFGNSLGSAIPGGYAFTGREWDPETNLYYYRARYYDPKIGRFISEDPIGFAGGLNFYSYVGNNPVNAVDPFGLVNTGFNIQFHPVQDVEQASPGKPTGGGRANLKWHVSWICQCEGDGFHATFTIKVEGEIYYYSGKRWPYKGRAPLDPFVTDPASAREHEENVHVFGPMDWGVALLTPWESITYPNKPICDLNSEVAAATAGDLVAAFSRAQY